ncbi:hypothetical protein AU504_11480 [Lonsdalea populi]|nr:hypothetical protein AU508_12165 [Lonsdalea populi]RAT69282.1 hypothetical protein AU504_11480 [Lonsdalea populi]RAT74650.1 hypothetical protein AU505_01450 [Lonsdalea populi]RAT76778.1 hypothetical protein AU506_04585 [Lonsdalea populi]RAT77026.1 hypothetical protein AU507_12815 [Lonsdalea populi]
MCLLLLLPELLLSCGAVLLDALIQPLLLKLLILLHLLLQPFLAADAVFKLLLLGRWQGGCICPHGRR